MKGSFPFPLALRWWIRVEKALYGGLDAPAMNDHVTDASIVVLYDGRQDVRALWSTLIECRTPHIQVVWVSPDGQAARLLAESYVAISEKLFFCKSLHMSLRRTATLIARARRRLSVAASLSTFPVVKIIDQHAGVTNVAAIRFAIRHLTQKALNQPVKLLFRRGHWILAYRRSNTEPSPYGSCETQAESANDWIKLPCPKGHFYADPFLWRSSGDDYHLFFEDFPYSTNRGTISHITLDPSTQAWQGTSQVVLERPYHLSYPFLFEYQGDIFMIPETSGIGTIEAYKASPFPSAWVLHKVIMRDVLAADTTLYHDGQRWWMFTSVAEDNGPNWDELSVFYSDNPFGDWVPHPMNPIASDCRVARMAGNLFRDEEDRLIRPAQNCEREYGAALMFREITELSPTAYAERTVSTRTPPRAHQGVHTWNAVGAITVIDLKMILRK